MILGYDYARLMTWSDPALTLDAMTPALGRTTASAAGAARHARRGLAGALAGKEVRPLWDRRSPLERLRVQAGLVTAALVLAVVNAASMRQATGGIVLRSGITAPHQLPAAAFEWLAAAAAVAPLLLAARAPLLAWRTGLLALLLAPLLPVSWWGGWPWGPAQVLALLAVFCLTGIGQRRDVLWGMWALTLLPWWLWLAARTPDLNGPVAATILFTTLTVAVDSMSSGLLARRILAVESSRADSERDRRAVLEERSRIARELHDVVAHHMSLIAVRAETAGYRLADVPAPALAEFADLSQLSREALSDMRRLLGVLRADLPAGLEPQPQLSDLPGLVETARQAGMTVSVASSGSGPLPASVSLCAYRIVQESLSNASQHAPGTAISIRVDQDDTAIRVHIANGPGGAGSHDHDGRPRHGLTGMRERVALLGGSLTTGLVPGGGFAVTAILPLAEAA